MKKEPANYEQWLTKAEAAQSLQCAEKTIRALDLVKRYADTKMHTFPAEEEVPLDGVVRGLWREAVIEEDAQG